MTASPNISESSRPSAPAIEQRAYIAGEWVRLPAGERSLNDPNTGEVRQPVRYASRAQVERALATAAAAHDAETIDAFPWEKRIELLRQTADRIDRRQAEIAIQDSMDTGVPISTTRTISSALGDRVRSAADEAESLGQHEVLDHDGRNVVIMRKPLGPALIIAPWNAPTFTAVGKIAAAVAAGCPVILKPSENAPNGCQILVECFVEAMESMGYPLTAIQLVHGSGEVGSWLSADERIEAVSFTGGDVAGRSVAQAAAGNLAVMQMELGSNNPVIVLDDADLDVTARSIVRGMTRLNGQWCEAPGKVLVPSARHDELVEAMAAEIAALVVGHGLDTTTEVGPMAFERHYQGLQNAVERLKHLGGTVTAGADLPPLDGWFLSPGIITGCTADQAVDELFGPLVTIHPVASTDEAIRLANGPRTGLDAFVFGSDSEKALDVAARIRAGEVRVNGTFMSDLAPGSQQTFWADSGIGGHTAESGVKFFLGQRVIGVDSASAPL
ncbi:aldehyde dehydrogenase [Brevibacterium sp. 'Marine']|uniref:aldehyde dehydrogenase family protein n=1 Tax=Brevibacterium sp. 'Marine' TaxID=2725563 RepID=UPI00145FC4DF|nr:aldehyde dehydrogenase [Brevibacterium sp. 'Marine']